MLAPEPLRGHRVVAEPAAIDALVAALPAGATSLRFAPDEVLVVGVASSTRDDPHAIVEDEVGFVAITVDRAVVRRHTEWALPAGGRRRARARSRVCPAKLAWLPDGRAWIVTHAAYAAELHGPPAMSEYTRTLAPIRWADEPKPAYDVVIIGGGGHGLSTAYHLATRHGITNVAVLEADYIASGNTGRNTTIIRANYGIPEAIRFYQHSLERYQTLEEETGAGDPAPDQGHRLAGPHRDGDAHRTRPRRR